MVKTLAYEDHNLFITNKNVKNLEYVIVFHQLDNVLFASLETGFNESRRLAPL